jgi:hypothetical protein
MEFQQQEQGSVRETMAYNVKWISRSFEFLRKISRMLCGCDFFKKTSFLEELHRDGRPRHRQVRE